MRISIVIIACFLCSPSIICNANDDFFADWVKTAAPCNLCHGYYKLPNIDPGVTEIIADSSRLDPDGKSIFRGNVMVSQSKQQIHASRMESYQDNQGTSNTQVLHDTSFRLYDQHIRGSAKKITIEDDTKMQLEQSKLTTCSPENKNPWYLKTKKLTLNQTTGRGTAEHAQLILFDTVPVFYFPYYNFPIDKRRQSGFLDPHLGYKSTYGFATATPYYFNLAPNADATLTPRFMSKRGLELQGKFRYLTVGSEGEIAATILPHDRLYDRTRIARLKDHSGMQDADPRLSALEKSGPRGAFTLQHKTTFNENITANIDYNYAGDSNYFVDLNNNFLRSASNSSLLQQATINFHNNYGSIRTTLQQYQILHPYELSNIEEPYRLNPQISIASQEFTIANNINYGINGQFSHFTHKLASNKYPTGMRYQARPYLSYNFSKSYLEITPRAQLDYTAYNLSATHPTRTTPIFDIDSKLIFTRDLQLNNTAFIQTLEPRLYYLYVPYKGGQHLLPQFDSTTSADGINAAFRDNRFNGLDRIGAANQISVGITSRFLNDHSGFEVAKLELGQVFYFRDRQVGLTKAIRRTEKSSDIFGRASYNINSKLSLYTDLAWDHRREKVASHSLGSQYLPDDRTSYNFSYQHRQDTILDSTPKRNVVLSAAIPIPPNKYKWRALGSLRYDLSRKRSNEILAGIEQDDCCTAIRILLGYDTKHQRNIAFQIVFKGLSSVGSADMEEIINKAIPGY